MALRSDSKIDTRPMTFYVEKPIQVAKLFDDIAYEKCEYRNVYSMCIE